MLRKNLWLPNQQPNFPVEIDPAFTRPTAAWVFSSNRDVLGRFVASRPVTADLEPSIIHTAIEDSTILAPTQDLVALNSGTYIVRYRKLDAVNRDSGIFGNTSSAVQERCGVHGPYSDGTVYWDFGGVTEGATRLSVAGQTFGLSTWAFTTGIRGMEIWKDGNIIASNTSNPSRIAVSNNFMLGNHAVSLSDLVSFKAFYAYRGVQLSVQELRVIGRGPFKPFRPASRRVWVAGSLGATFSVSATASLAISKQLTALSTASVAIRKTLTLSSTGSAALQKTFQSVATATSAIQKTLNVTSSGSAAVQKTLLALSTASAALQKALVLSASAGPHITSASSPTRTPGTPQARTASRSRRSTSSSAAPTSSVRTRSRRSWRPSSWSAEASRRSRPR